MRYLIIYSLNSTRLIDRTRLSSYEERRNIKEQLIGKASKRTPIIKSQERSLLPRKCLIPNIIISFPGDFPEPFVIYLMIQLKETIAGHCLHTSEFTFLHSTSCKSPFVIFGCRLATLKLNNQSFTVTKGDNIESNQRRRRNASSRVKQALRQLSDRVQIGKRLPLVKTHNLL